MFAAKPAFFLTILLLLLFFFISSSISDGASQINRLQSEHTSWGKGKNDVVSWGMRRSVIEENNKENPSLVLAAERTHRKDPFDDFKYYKRGWNISEEHYISSVAFTATPLFLIAAIWFVCFGLSLLLLCFCYCCCQKRPYGYSRTAYALSLILLALFTVTAIVGSVVLYTGQGKFHDTTSDTLVYVVKQANKTVDNLKNVSYYLAAAKNIGVDQIFLPPDVQGSIDKVDIKISAAATALQIETKRNSNNIQDALETVRLALIIIAAVMLVLAFLGFVLSILGLQFLVYILVIIGWILITITFILGGVFLALHNVVGDTCFAMDEWVQNPTAHTALDDILPCVDNATAQETLSQSKDVTFQLAQMVNRIIVNISNIDFPPRAGPLYYNQSGPLVPVLCNPFNPDKTNRTCAPGEVDFNNATQVWRGYVCEVSESNICTSRGRLTPNMFDQMNGAVNVSYGLYEYGPWLTDLLDCTFVRDTFRGIHKDYCGGLRLYSKWIYIGLGMVSAAVMLSLIFWVIYARERRHRKYTKLAKAAASAQNSFEDKA